MSKTNIRLYAKCGICGKNFEDEDILIFLSHLQYDHNWNIDDVSEVVG